MEHTESKRLLEFYKRIAEKKKAAQPIIDEQNRIKDYVLDSPMTC